MKTAIVLCLLLVSFACSHTPAYNWQKPNATEQDFNTDKWQCQKEIIAVAGQGGSWASGDIGFVIAANEVAKHRAQNAAQEMFNSCMQSKGWQAMAIHP